MIEPTEPIDIQAQLLRNALFGEIMPRRSWDELNEEKKNAWRRVVSAARSMYES